MLRVHGLQGRIERLAHAASSGLIRRIPVELFGGSVIARDHLARRREAKTTIKGIKK